MGKVYMFHVLFKFVCCLVAAVYGWFAFGVACAMFYLGRHDSSARPLKLALLTHAHSKSRSTSSNVPATRAA